MSRIISCTILLICLAATDVAHGAAAKDLIGNADGFFLRNEFDFAIEEYTDFLQKYPDHEKAAHAGFQLGQCHFKLKKYADAAKAFGAAATKKPDDALLAKVLYRLGECESKLGNWAKAAAAYEQLVEKAPKNRLAPAALSAQAEALYKLKKFKDTASACVKLTKDYADSKYTPIAWYTLGWARFEQKDYEGAAEAFETVVSKYPKESTAPQSQLKIGECRYELKDYRKALAAYGAVVARYPGEWSDEAFLGAGSCQFALKKYSKAAAAFERMAADYPKAPDAPLALLNAANSHLADGQPAKAVLAADKFDATYARSPLAPRVTAARARAMLKLKKYPEAAKHFQKAFHVGLPKSEQAAANYGFGEALFQTGKYLEAAMCYETVVSDFKTHPLADDSAYALIFCWDKLGKTKDAAEACAAFEKAYAKSRLMGSVKQVEGEYRYRLKDYAAARDACAKSLELDADGPQADDTIYKLAWAHRQLNDHAKAEATFLKLVETMPGSPFVAESLYMAGRAATAAKETARAETHFRACEQKFPKSAFAANAAYQLALLSYRTPDFKAARQRFDHFLRTYPKSDLASQALVYAGESEFQTKHFDRARELYERQLKDYAEAGKKWADIAVYGVAWCDRKAGKMAGAAAGFQKVVDDFPKSKLAAASLFWTGRCREDNKDFDKAVAAYTAFVEKHPGDPLVEKATFRLCTSAYGAGKYGRAADAYDAFVKDRPKSDFADNALYDLAWCRKKLKQPKEARAAYARLIENYPGSDVIAHALFDLGNLLFEAKDYQAATERYEAAAAKNMAKLQDRVLYRLGVTYAYQKQHASAEKTFAKLVAGHPKSKFVADAHYHRGRALQLLGKLDDALAAFKKAIDAKPTEQLTELAMFQAAECYREKKDWASGLTAYKSALKAYPKSQLASEMKYGVGLCSQNLGAYADATEAYKEVIAATGTVTAARSQYGLAECLMLRGELRKAMKEFIRVEITYGYDEWCAAGLYMAGQCAEKMKKPERARTYYKQLLDNAKYRATLYGPKATAAVETLDQSTN
jgi:TolA-binding protein